LDELERTWWRYLHDWRRGMRWCGFEVGSTRASSKAIRTRMSWGRRNMSFGWGDGRVIKASGVRGII